ISGLSAAGLVLTDNGADALSVAANATSFAFPTALATGSNYAVAIKSQPLGQTCTVANGSGTAGANVTNVTVSCRATPLYTIGGSVSGFTALSGLVLLDNGGDALTIPVNATHFTFATALAAGSTYKVTVQDPGPIGENCTVTNGSGTLNANVTDVSVSCVSQFAASNTNVASISVARGRPPRRTRPSTSRWLR